MEHDKEDKNTLKQDDDSQHKVKDNNDSTTKQLSYQKQELEQIIAVLIHNEIVTIEIRAELIRRLKALLTRVSNSLRKDGDNAFDNVIHHSDVEVKVEESVFGEDISRYDQGLIKEESEDINHSEDNVKHTLRLEDETNVLKTPKEKILKKLKIKRKVPKELSSKKIKKPKNENININVGVESDIKLDAVKTDIDTVNTPSDGSVRFYCDQCAYSSSIFTNLKLHISNHHSTTQYPCDQCQYVACAKNFLRRHKSRVHGGVRYYCELCEYSTTCMSNLKRHKESKHEGVKYTCEDCNYSATLKQSLQRHISTKHKGIKFPCNICSFSANHISDLNKHKKRMHKEGAEDSKSKISTENKCDECHFTAQNHANLKKHKKIKHNFTDL